MTANTEAHQVVDLTELRTALGKVISFVHYGDNRVVVVRHGTPVAALVPIEDLERLDRDDSTDE